MHGSEPGGRPLGFVIDFPGGQKVYFSGDTWIFGDMALIQEIYKPTVLLLQVGGGPFNQDPTVAALAVKKYFKPKTIIPMHYGTWPILASEDAVKAAFKGDARLKVMKPGETAKL
jgi:L-ascorbate metabolism protein UlaG (beta-lactamase superfamily)